MDEVTGLWYQTDKNFIETGINHAVVSDTFTNPFYGPLKTVRSFPEGNRNCYNLKPKQGKNSTYNIQAVFSYQNYDNRNQLPRFHLYVGANYWVTVVLVSESQVQSYTIIYHSSADIIQVCFVNTGLGTPFISSLELQSLNSNNSIYSDYSSSLPLTDWGGGRIDTGAYQNPPNPYRYRTIYHHFFMLVYFLSKMIGKSIDF